MEKLKFVDNFFGEFSFGRNNKFNDCPVFGNLSKILLIFFGIFIWVIVEQCLIGHFARTFL
jgi:hypothetical protein